MQTTKMCLSVKKVTADIGFKVALEILWHNQHTAVGRQIHDISLFGLRPLPTFSCTCSKSPLYKLSLVAASVIASLLLYICEYILQVVN